MVDCGASLGKMLENKDKWGSSRVRSLKSRCVRSREVRDWKKKELWSGIRVLEFRVPDMDQCKVMAEPKR